MRQFTAEFNEYASLALEVATKEMITAALSRFVPEVKEKQAYIDGDGAPQVRDSVRSANTSEIASARAAGFAKTISKIFMRRLKPKSFFKKIELERLNLGVKSLSDLIALCKVMAKEEDARGTQVDQDGTRNVAITTTIPAARTASTPLVVQSNEPKDKGKESNAQTSTVRAPTGRYRNCKHCGGEHWDSDCPTLTQDPEAKPKVYNRANGTLRAKPTPKVQANNAQEEEEEEILTTEAVVNGDKYSIIVDTGAGKSFISSRTLHTMKETDKSLKTAAAPTLKVVQADGSVTKCREKVLLTLTINKLAKTPVRFKQWFHVLTGTEHKLLLGCGALRSVVPQPHRVYNPLFINAHTFPLFWKL